MRTFRVLLCAACGQPQQFDELDLSMFCANPHCPANTAGD